MTAAHGATLDAHVVARSWNASDLDLLVGYSSQVHSLTNIPIKIKRWKAVVILSRLMCLVLIVQAAILASLLGCGSSQAWGSIIWQGCYAVMPALSHARAYRDPDTLIRGLNAVAIRAKPLLFDGRRAALAFVATMPGIKQKAGVAKWDWLDGFMPNNKRRRDWIADFMAANQSSVSDESPEWAMLSADVKKLLSQVRTARRDRAYLEDERAFLRGVGLEEFVISL
jgi:hypothetical protein